MDTDPKAKFPTFECVISNTMEDYDSEVENFFLYKNYLAAQLSKLRVMDEEWADNYEKMMKYMHDLAESIVNRSDAPSHDFLIDLSMGDELEDDTILRLIDSRSVAVAEITSASLRVREIMYWYVRNSKDRKFSSSFTPERFQGLPFLRLALVYRSVNLSKK